MDFSLSDDQAMLSDTLKKFFEREYPVETRGMAVSATRELVAKRWQIMADMGLLGMPLAPEVGGSGFGCVETMLIMEEYGRSLAVEPYMASVVLVGTLLNDVADGNAVVAKTLEAAASGTTILALAAEEVESRYDLKATQATATSGAGGYVLNARKSLVLAGNVANTFVVLARTSGNPGDADDFSLFLVDRAAPGVSVREHRTLDGRWAASVDFENVSVAADHQVGPLGGALRLVETAMDRACAAICAEAVGAMAGAIELTAEYLKVRKQFGQPLAKFQALQHRAVDMKIAYEQARSLAMTAAMALDADDKTLARRLVSAAKVQVSGAGRLIGKEAIQMHGGMGMTDECKAGHFAKRLLVIGQLFGDAQHHLDRFVAEDAAVAQN